MYRRTDELNSHQKTKASALLNSDKVILTDADLAILWGITNKNTLWTTTSRYAKRGLLHKIRKGLYSKKAIAKLDSFELGCGLTGAFSYVSLATVLAKHGVISQFVYSTTLIGEKKLLADIGGHNFIVRSMKPEYLQNRTGITEGINYSVASLERAVADMMYYNPKYFFDNERAVDWDKVAEIKEKVGY